MSFLAAAAAATENNKVYTVFVIPSITQMAELAMIGDISSFPSYKKRKCPTPICCYN